MKDENTYDKYWNELKLFDVPNDPGFDVADLPIRYSARTVLIDENNHFILSHSAHYDAHSVPGGGIEKHETIDEATVRECKEETGYDIEFITKLGYFKFYGENFQGKKYLLISFSYLARAIGVQEELNLMDHEKALGLSARCYPYEDAIKVLEGDVARTGNHYSVRSILLIKEAKKYIDEHKSGK